MIEVHLYGKLRKYSGDMDPTTASIARINAHPGETIQSIVDRLGIPPQDLGSNKFLNGRYADMSAPVQDGDRLGLFPDDMQLLYKWYFDPTQSSASGAPRQGSAASKPDTETASKDSVDKERSEG